MKGTSARTLDYIMSSCVLYFMRYSLVKMVYSIAESSKQKPTWPELELAIRRNFGGLDKSDPVAIFGQFISEAQVTHVCILKLGVAFYFLID